MDYSLLTSSTKGKEEVKMVIKPTTNLEREFFNNLFTNGGPIIEPAPNGDEVTIVLREKAEKPPTVDDLPF